MSARCPSCRSNVLVVLHPCSVARRLDQQISHRRSTRSVAGLAATLAHEVKNPLSGIRGAAQLLEPAVRRGGPAADPADLRRDRPDLRPGRPDGGVRRHRAGRARLGQHPPGAGACAPDRRGRLRAPPPHRRALRPVAARGRGRPRPAGPGVPEPGQERRRGDAGGRAARSRWRPSTSTGCASRSNNSRDAARAADHGRGPRQRPGRAARTWSTTCSSRSSAPSAAAAASACRWSPRSWPTIAASSPTCPASPAPSSGSGCPPRGQQQEPVRQREVA